MRVKSAIKNRAAEMHDELLECKLEVVLMPAPEPRHCGHCIRVAVNRPPVWFSDVARRVMKTSGRQTRPRPTLSRKATLRALAAISIGEIKTDYARRWMKEIERILANELNEVPF